MSNQKPQPSCLHFQLMNADQKDENATPCMTLHVSSPFLVETASLEAAVEATLIDECSKEMDDTDHCDDDQAQAVLYPVRSEIALLHCERFDVNSSGSDSFPSLFGLLESGVDRVRLSSCIPSLPNNTNPCRVTTLSAALAPLSPKSWKRTIHNLPLNEEIIHVCPDMLWVDLRSVEMSDQLAKPIGCLHFLRSLLGEGHSASPWSSESARHACVALLLSQAPESLLNFRVSDASPSFYLHSIIRCQSLPSRPWEFTSSLHDNATTSAPCILLVYRHLPPRFRLTFRHPHTQQSAPPGTLWETLPDPHVAAAGDNIIESPSPIITRLTSQPFLDALTEYPSLKLLLNDFPMIQQEAVSIQNWTAWPETTHYARNQESGATPWTVFPLCYCFPATDERQMKWIKQTSAFCPHTTRALDKLKPFLRTALFSRLEPEALLQAHTGWEDLANHVIRVHLPLQCPPGDACGLWVDGCVESLREGQFVAFDDSKVHWAYNYSPDQERIVLILDMVRPSDLPKGTAVGGHSEELDAFIQSVGGT